MSAITPMPMVVARWVALLPNGSRLSGTVEMPDCDGALDLAHRALVEGWQSRGIKAAKRAVIVWRLP
jgi:hypothetical protein